VRLLYSLARALGYQDMLPILVAVAGLTNTRHKPKSGYLVCLCMQHVMPKTHML
jgi:hypothetical protein